MKAKKFSRRRVLRQIRVIAKVGHYYVISVVITALLLILLISFFVPEEFDLYFSIAVVMWEVVVVAAFTALNLVARNYRTTHNRQCQSSHLPNGSPSLLGRADFVNPIFLIF